MHGTWPGGGSGGSGGGGGFGGGGSSTGDQDPGPGFDPACDLLWPQAAEADCHLGSPPPLVVNGCGAAGSIDLVPDGLIGVPQFGNIFTPACNAHDTCYGTYGTDKHGCDRKLRDDMVNGCKDIMDAQEEAIWMNSCVIQAEQYSSTLQNPFFEYLVSGSAFISAQDEGFCRLLTDEARTFSCL